APGPRAPLAPRAGTSWPLPGAGRPGARIPRPAWLPVPRAPSVQAPSVPPPALRPAPARWPGRGWRPVRGPWTSMDWTVLARDLAGAAGGGRIEWRLSGAVAQLRTR